MEMPAAFDAPVNVPGNRVDGALLDGHHTHRTDPSFSLFGIRTHGLLDLKLNAALYFDTGN
jgi:hypothetical protein